MAQAKMIVKLDAKALKPLYLVFDKITAATKEAKKVTKELKNLLNKIKKTRRKK